MKILVYRDLDTASIPGYSKLAKFLEAGDFRSADVKKIDTNLYRARLDRSNRLLFALHRYAEETCILVLEYISQHAYEKSRFLSRGSVIDEEKIPVVDTDVAAQAPQLPYLNPKLPKFHLLDKVLSFDDDQEAVYAQKPPLIIIGSAGSGKTALTLEKMKDVHGSVLYVTRSAFLVQNARELYFAHGYANENQDIDFLSFREYLESIRVPEGKEVTPRIFAAWTSRQRLPKELADSHRLFEEIQGAITGVGEDTPYLTKADYLALGVRQSIYTPEFREEVYEVFERYLRFLDEQNLFDLNIIAHAWLSYVKPCYDFVVVDEVQDLTAVQLLLILGSLQDTQQFLLCGDSNQIVHPNFFSWAKIKTLFWRQHSDDTTVDLLRILSANFRNSAEITELANRLLHIKQARFGSVDRESNYLVQSRGQNSGKVILLPNKEEITRDLNKRTATSTRFAILVLHAEQKAEVKKYFKTPLVFSIQEAKGLEYENVLLYGFISGEAKRFRDIAAELTSEDLQGTLQYARARNKGDKSLEIYKFYINALYVAVTRAIKNLYIIESNTKHHLLTLLDLQDVKDGVDDVEEQKSSIDDWRREAHKLELQGKEEQAAEIREQILKQKQPPWQVLTDANLVVLEKNAMVNKNKKARVSLLEYALVYQDQRLINRLIMADFTAASYPDKAIATLEKKHYLQYTLKTPGGVLREVDKYGVDFRDVFNHTPLMIASRMGHAVLVKSLIDLGANTSLVDSNGFNAFQNAIKIGCSDARFAQNKISAIWDYIAPPSIDLRIEGRLVRLDQHLMEYIMFSIAMVLFYKKLAINWVYHYPKRHLLTAGDFETALGGFPDGLIPEQRKKRTYISSILAKNEMTKEARYNRKLFIRVARGQYLLNPNICLRVEGEWHYIYDLLVKKRLAAPYVREIGLNIAEKNRWNMVQEQLVKLQEYLGDIARSAKKYDTDKAKDKDQNTDQDQDKLI